MCQQYQQIRYNQSLSLNTFNKQSQFQLLDLQWHLKSIHGYRYKDLVILEYFKAWLLPDSFNSSRLESIKQDRTRPNNRLANPASRLPSNFFIGTARNESYKRLFNDENRSKDTINELEIRPVIQVIARDKNDDFVPDFQVSMHFQIKNRAWSKHLPTPTIIRPRRVYPIVYRL